MSLTGAPGYDESRLEPLLRVADVVTWLSISRRTLYRLIAAGELTPVYIDSYPRFEPVDVDRLVQERRGRRPRRNTKES